MDVVEKTYLENGEVISALQQKEEWSLASSMQNTSSRVLILTAASYFEHIVVRAIEDYVNDEAKKSPALISFVRRKAIDRQYHTYFSWDQSNANSFLGLFGDEFKQRVDIEINSDDALRAAVRAFLEIGRLRNQLVHRNFGAYMSEKNSEEVLELYRSGLAFVNRLQGWLREYGSVVWDNG